MNFQYQYPQAFYLLALVPFFLLLFLLYQLWKKRAMRRAGNPVLMKQMMKGHSPAKTWIKALIVLVAFAAGCVAVANPRRPDDSSPEARKGIDLIIALDISNSMLAKDIAPDRLTRAKQMLSRLVDNLKDDRIGLVLFAGNGYLQMPLTFDRSAAKMYISTATPGTIASQGTSVADALKKASVGFGEETERFRSVVLVTDGETHDEDALDEVKKMASKGVMINTVGIGSTEGSTIEDSSGVKKDENGAVVVSKLNESFLQQIAKSTNGTYIHLENAEAAVREIMDQYTNIEKKALGDTSLYTYETFYVWFVGPMVALLLLDLLITDRKRIPA